MTDINRETLLNEHSEQGISASKNLLVMKHRKSIKIRGQFRPFPWFIYVATGFLAVVYAVLILQWSLYTQDSLGQAIDFLERLWGPTPSFQFLNNFFVWLLVFLILTFLINRFWISTPLFLSLVSVISIIQRMKVTARNEVIIPSDLLFLNGNAGEIASFIPTLNPIAVWKVIGVVSGAIMISVLFFIIDGRRKLIDFKKLQVQVIARITLVVIPIAILFLFAGSLGNPDTWSRRIANKLSDDPVLFNSYDDARINGTTMSFLHLLNPDVMHAPDDYSQSTMENIAEKYHDTARQINETRTRTLTDQTVIFVLSESFSDPLRVPGLQLNADPIPRIREIKARATSGLMLSPGYGGGTANIEYEALTGLSLTNFNPSLTTPYQQLVPQQENPFTLNQLWNRAHGSQSSEAIHPFNPAMYFRGANYRKFGFSHFWTDSLETKKEGMRNNSHIDSSGYVSDKSAYQEVLNRLEVDPNNKFIQLVTMQNHMPYPDWYLNNQYTAENSSGLPISDEEQIQLRTYAKGLEHTDVATNDFLQQLNSMSTPITVVFYGDHLPGIYGTERRSEVELLALHQTDYFIWSNNASDSLNPDTSETNTNITSANYFSALLTTHTNSRVSPYLAFLTKMNESIPAVEAVNLKNNDKDKSNFTYLDRDGEVINIHNLTKNQKRLLHDYELIQYDMTVGNNYLEQSNFTQLP